MDEVDPAVYELEATYMEQIQDILDGGTFTDARDWVLEQDDVVEAHADDRQLAFRLEGGRPVFVIDPIVEGDASSWDARMQLAGALEENGEASRTRRPETDIVGRETDRDNPQNRKRALILEPYYWELGQHFDAGAGALRGIADYQHDGGVTHLANEQVTPEMLSTWRHFDAIFMMTHGGNIDRWRWIASGHHEPVAGRGPNRYERCVEHFDQYFKPVRTGVDCQYLALGGSLDQGGELNLVLGVSTEFFGAIYKPTARHPFYGLRKAIVYIGGCGVLRNDDMALFVAGTTSAFLGWDNFVTVGKEDGRKISEFATEELLTLLVDPKRLLPVGPAYDELVKQRLVTDPNNHNSTLRLWTHDEEARKLRMYDLPSPRDPRAPTNILENGAEMRIQGTPGDGDEDRLEIAVEVIGVIDPEDTSGELPEPPPSAPPPPPSDDPGNAYEGIMLASNHESPADLYDIHFYVGDERIGSDNLGQHRKTAEVEKIDATTYRYKDSFPLPFDVDTSGTRTTLKVVVDLPEGGISDYEIDVTLTGRSYALIQVGSTTYEFEGTGSWQCFIGLNDGEEVGVFAGSGNADGDYFSAQLDASGGVLNVHDDSTGADWHAIADREQVTNLGRLPEGRSQIDTITIENGRAWGQATFIDTDAVGKALSENRVSPVWPPSFPGTFDILCGG